MTMHETIRNTPKRQQKEQSLRKIRHGLATVGALTMIAVPTGTALAAEAPVATPSVPTSQHEFVLQGNLPSQALVDQQQAALKPFMEQVAPANPDQCLAERLIVLPNGEEEIIDCQGDVVKVLTPSTKKQEAAMPQPSFAARVKTFFTDPAHDVEIASGTVLSIAAVASLRRRKQSNPHN